MKGKISTLLIGLLMAVVFVGTSVRIQAVDTAETEPNDDSTQAQTLTLTPGQSDTITGTVAAADKSTFVESLELLFTGLNDPQEDWFKFTVGAKPVEAAFQVGWTPGSADVDSWQLCSATDLLYTDKLIFFNAAASLDNPEVYPNALYYRYTDRALEADSKPPVLPDSSDYYTTVSFYNPTAAPRASYRFTYGAPAVGSTRTVNHTAYEFGPWSIATARSFGASNNVLRVLTRITPAEYPARLDDMSFLQFNIANGPKVGDTFKIIALLDPDGDGNLANAQQVLTRDATITALNPQANTGSFLTYDLKDANIVATGGDIYVGVETDARVNVVHVGFEAMGVGFLRSPIFLDGGNQSVVTLMNDLTGTRLAANAGITANLTINPPVGKVTSANPPSSRPAPPALFRLKGAASGLSTVPYVGN